MPVTCQRTVRRLVVTVAVLLGPSAATMAQGHNHALALNGLDAFGTAAGVGDLTRNSTWEAWINIPDATPTIGNRPVLFRWGMWSHGLDVNVATQQLAASQYSCGTNCPEGESTPGSVSPGVWHHVAAVLGPESGPSCTMYLDGQPVAYCGPQPCTPYAGWETVLGAYGFLGYAGFLHATVDEARISDVPRYSDAFVPARRFDLDASTVGLWHFDEGSGNLANDSSVHGRHFTLHGGFSWVAGNSSGNPTFTAFGQGCAGSAGSPLLTSAPGSVPRLGTTFRMRLSNLPNSPVHVPIGFLGYGNTSWWGIPLPVSLGSLGMPPECLQHIDPTDGFTYTLVNAGGNAIWDVPIPNLSALHDTSVFVQAIVMDWGLPFDFPAVSTNGGDMRIRH